MTTMTAATTAPQATPAELLDGWDHLELWVGNARAMAQLLISGFGFRCTGYAGPETGIMGRASYLLEQGEIRFLVTAGLGPDSEVTAHVRRHGDGVRSVALATRHVDAAFDFALAHGAQSASAPADQDDEHGSVRRAALCSYGSTELCFVDRAGYGGNFGPGFAADGLPAATTGSPVGLEALDHVVGNVEQGRLDDWVRWHEVVLGFTEMRHFDADQISTEFSALRSTVMWNGRQIVLPLNEPAEGRRKSQIQEFLDAYTEPGVQHLALRTPDIVTAVDELQSRGIRFLTPPPSYYDDARRRCGDIDVPWAELARLGILVDVDAGGYLLQVFTETVGDRPTLFFEVIQRHGATGFGDGNFKALFEAIEREQARRGNL
ncbi:MAG TPA: 4-hydroxyphenylpyruvate dioxygenase [Acidimicrobiales bacterium]|nr:4-hydroxyphenylpyruvate dioxygenase [Acidimicrobiales bacterium]